MLHKIKNFKFKKKEKLKIDIYIKIIFKMLDKYTRANYKITGNVPLHSDCINIKEHNKLINEYNNLNDKFKILETKFNEIINENDDIYEKNKVLQKENKLLKKHNERIKGEIISKNIKIAELENYINDFIRFSLKYNINNIDELKSFIIDKTNYINDDIMFIDLDIFEYEPYWLLEKQIEDYEYQLEIVDNIFIENNVKSLQDLKKRLSNNFYKYDKIFTILKDADIKSKILKNKENKLINNIINFDNKLKIVKDKISKLAPGTIIEIKGIKKVYKSKIEKRNIIKMIEKEFNEYCQEQIKWAKDIIGNNYNDSQVIRLLDIYNKLKYNNSSSSDNETDIENEYFNILNINKKAKLLELESYFKLGKNFINKNVNSKKDLSNNDLLFIKEVIKSSDISYGKKDEKINRFINICKRYYILSQKIENTDTIIKSKSKTYIRDMNNNDFDSLLKLLDKNIK